MLMNFLAVAVVVAHSGEFTEATALLPSEVAIVVVDGVSLRLVEVQSRDSITGLGVWLSLVLKLTRQETRH